MGVTVYWCRKEKPAMSKKTRDILILALSVAVALDIVLAIVLLSGSTSDTKLSDTLISYSRTNVANARTTATQLSRTGSSYTTQMLGDMKQYIYGVDQINLISQALLGRKLYSQTAIDAALEAIEQCETKTLAGQAMDEPLATLWAQVNQLEAEAAALTN